MPSRVLIVDDTDTVRMFQRMTLLTAGYELAEARNGQQALDVVQRFCPDVILLDVNMPVLDGLEACRRLKGAPETSAIPIIMVTTRGLEGQVKEAYDAGCDDYVTKPIRKIELLAKIKRLLDRSQGNAESWSAPPCATTT